MDDVKRVGEEGQVVAVDKPSFERIVSENGSFVRRTLAQLGVPMRCLADVEQEVYRGVHRGLPGFDPALAPQPGGAVRSWLFGICERQAASHRRSEARRGEVLVAVDDLDTAQDVPDTEESLIEAERKALLHQLLATLEPRRRAVVVAYELEGIPMVDVAAAVGIPVNTAWNRLRLAREDLRSAWARMAAQRGAGGAPARPATGGSQPPAMAAARAVAMGAGARPAMGTGARPAMGTAARPAVVAEQPCVRGGVLAPLAAILGPLAFKVDPAAPSWVRLPVLKLPAAIGAIAGTTLGAAGVVVAALVLRQPDVLSARPDGASLAAGQRATLREVTSAQSDSPAAAPTGTSVSPATVDVPPAATVVGSAAARPAGAPARKAGAAPASRRSSVDVALREEVANLTAAANAFDSGDTQLALSLVASHERTFPGGKMAEQRELLRVRALMAEGRRNEARDCARDFLRAHPNSPVRANIEALVGSLD